MTTVNRMVEVSIFDMTEAELRAESESRREAGEVEHADQLLAFTALRGRAVAAYPDLPVQEAMERQHAEEAAP